MLRIARQLHAAIAKSPSSSHPGGFKGENFSLAMEGWVRLPLPFPCRCDQPFVGNMSCCQSSGVDEDGGITTVTWLSAATSSFSRYHAAAAAGVFDEADFLVPSLYFGKDDKQPGHEAGVFGYSNATMAAALSIRRSGGEPSRPATALPFCASVHVK